MDKKKREEILKLCHEIENKKGVGSIYSLGSDKSILNIPRISTCIEDLDFVLGGGIPVGRIIEIFGPESCVTGDTHINYKLVDRKTDRLINMKGGKIKYLYQRLHDYENYAYKSRATSVLDKDKYKLMVQSINEKTNRIFFNEIADVVECGVKPCFHVVADKGFCLTCTKEHKFYVGNGKYEALENLHVGDDIYIHNKTKMHEFSKVEPNMTPHEFYNSFMAVPTKIKSIEFVGDRMTYDIKCYSPYNNYLANRVVVHNSGKTSLGLHICSLYDMALYLPIEGTFDAERAKIFGNRPKQLLVGRTDYGEETLDMVLKFTKLGIPMIIVDSVPSLIPKAEIDKINKGLENERQPGDISRLLSRSLPEIVRISERTGTTVIFINQVRDKVGAMLFGEKLSTPGGRALKHLCSVRIQVGRRDWIEVPNKDPRNSAANVKIGIITKCKVVKSKICNPYGECEIPMIFDRGYVSHDDVLTIRKEIMAENRKKQRENKVNK